MSEDFSPQNGRHAMIAHVASPEFLALAGRWQMAPERLAKLLCDNIGKYPPHQVIIISRLAKQQPTMRFAVTRH